MTTTGVFREFVVPTPDAQPYAIVKGPDNNIWFTEVVGDNLGRVTTAGTVTEFAVPPPAGNPTVLCAGPDGNLWFNLGAKSGYRLARATTTGLFTEFPIAIDVEGVAAGSDGNIWFSDVTDNQIVRLTIAP